MKLTLLLNESLKCPRCGQLGRWRAVARADVRANSEIHRLQCENCGERVAAKASKAGAAGGSVRREHETLRCLQALFPQDARYGTLVPLAYLEDGERDVMVTEWFDGENLARYARAVDDLALGSAFLSTGTWLRKLHECDLSAKQSRALDVADKLESLRRTGQAVLNGDSSAKSTYALLERVGLQITQLKVPVARIHGDFKPQNVLCNGTRYIGIDTQWTYSAPVVYDLAPFLDHVWLGGSYIRQHSSRRRCELAQENFLKGYGYPSDAIALTWAQLYFAIHYWIDWRRSGALTSIRTLPKVRSLLRALAADLALLEKTQLA